MRDEFSKTIKEILAKRVAYRCSNPNCRQLTSGPKKKKDGVINIGVAAHIVPASTGFIRDDPSISSEERKSIDNGIWLCQSCAKLIDSDEKRYSIDLLREWKRLSEYASLLELETKNKDVLKNDIELIKFYAECFDRPAFQDHFSQEGSMEAFDKAIEDTILALNTGYLRSRDGKVLAKSKGKSFIANDSWRQRLGVIVEMLRAIRERYSLALQNKEITLGSINNNRQFYCIKNHELAEWFDLTRFEILRMFERICNEAGLNFHFYFPRNRRF